MAGGPRPSRRRLESHRPAALAQTPAPPPSWLALDLPPEPPSPFPRRPLTSLSFLPPCSVPSHRTRQGAKRARLSGPLPALAARVPGRLQASLSHLAHRVHHTLIVCRCCARLLMLRRSRGGEACEPGLRCCARHVPPGRLVARHAESESRAVPHPSWLPWSSYCESMQMLCH